MISNLQVYMASALMRQDALTEEVPNGGGAQLGSAEVSHEGSVGTIPHPEHWAPLPIEEHTVMHF